jgi:hypothetical protein
VDFPRFWIDDRVTPLHLLNQVWHSMA